ncbi:hypothetical protein F2A31_03505 [Acinetobacter suaedae]|uniref:Lipoprotein n=1 Tax=Acinetobacter suaedae TaxID=2609668 RepID=A0A5P1URR3_9GAMM|nr:hypothetical protein [Acinetobacter sp. C16S1]QER38813.1 hypothetical protein F2A31_03505 [Acinetobacter sp. C16S1]
MKSAFKMICLIYSSLMLSGCAGSPVGKLIGNVEDKKTKTLLQNMVGHPLNDLVAQIGRPNSSVQDMLAKDKVYMHTWTIQKYARDRFVKTGTEYVGSSMVGVTPAGNGVAATPIYQGQYRDKGYNTPTYYTCMITVYTDANGIILEKGHELKVGRHRPIVYKTKAVGGFCDEFLGLK